MIYVFDKFISKSGPYVRLFSGTFAAFAPIQPDVLVILPKMNKSLIQPELPFSFPKTLLSSNPGLPTITSRSL
jgi:hypothetical protein